MAQSNEAGYELYAVCDAVSVSSRGMENDSPRNITIMDQPGTSDDPYGGHKQREILADVEVSEVPDGKQLEPEDHPAYGYDDDRTYAIWVKGSDPQVATVAYHDMKGL